MGSPRLDGEPTTPTDILSRPGRDFPAGVLLHVLLQSTLVTRWIARGTLFGSRDVVTLHALSFSGTRLPKGGLIWRRTSHLYILHHATVLMAEDMAVQHGLASEVGGQHPDLGIAGAVSRSTAPTDRHFVVFGRYPVALPRQLFIFIRADTDIRTLLLRIGIAEERTRGEVPTVPLFD